MLVIRQKLCRHSDGSFWKLETITI